MQRPAIRDLSLPNFHPAGGEFISNHETLGLCRMRFPGGQIIGSAQPQDVFPEREYGFGYEMHYLGPDAPTARSSGRTTWRCTSSIWIRCAPRAAS